MLSLRKKIFNKDSGAEVVVKDKDGNGMVIQINSCNEIDYTVYDKHGHDVDGGIFEADNATFAQLFAFAGFDSFNRSSVLLSRIEAEEYVESLY